MALSGTIVGTKKGYFGVEVDWTAVQSVENNTSTITAKVFITYWSIDIPSRTASCTIDGHAQSVSVGAISHYPNKSTRRQVAAFTQQVSHATDGSKSLTLSASFNFDLQSSTQGYVGTLSASSSITLDTIPRASSLSFGGFTIGSAGTITITRAKNTFTHKITYAFGGASGTVGTGIATSVSWTPPVGLLDQIPQSVSGTGTLTCITYSGDVEIGRRDFTFTAAAAESVKPSVSISVTDVDGDITQFGGAVQGRSRLLVALTGTPNHSSPIRSYVVTVDGKTYTGSVDSSSTATVTTDALQNSGSKSVSVTVTDARGRKSSAATSSVTVLAYAAPVVTLSAYRCTSAGVADEEGAYMRIALSSTISSLGGHNRATYLVRYRAEGGEWTELTGSGTSYTTPQPIPASAASIYNVEATVTDVLEVAGIRATNIPIAYVLMDFRSTGKGIAFGRVSTEDGFVCAMDAFFDKGVRLPDKCLRIVHQNSDDLPELPAGVNTFRALEISGDSTDNARYYILATGAGKLYVGYRSISAGTTTWWEK